MAWAWLLLAGLLEVMWAGALKASNEFTRWVPNVVTAIGLIASPWCLSRAFREIPMGTAYAIWTGIGTAGVAVVGMALYDEPVNLARMGFLGMILVGIAGLKLMA
ncbi:MAG TPA: multidrug efflux SMR transporter [Aliidongia sp.]|uniref:DMT family transporter n=1 Tax=Aliidongia sp. TaxID=1914230 RepID=UPI002DDCB02F|nr:multidrug efflux SMR transporter [Aliidongia sp.]HEV2678146.1 multidrug efflux SMR transporter [Aliidongia sp.]